MPCLLTTPLCPLIEVYRNVLVSGSCKTSCPLFGVKRYPLFGSLVNVSYKGRSAGERVKHSLDGGIHYREVTKERYSDTKPLLKCPFTFDVVFKTINFL